MQTELMPNTSLTATYPVDNVEVIGNSMQIKPDIIRKLNMV